MEDVEKLFKSSTEEMEKLLTAKSVVGEPMVVDGYTIVPLLSLGFGFGAGGGVGKGKNGDNHDGEGSGGGTGGGGGVSPLPSSSLAKTAFELSPYRVLRPGWRSWVRL